MVFSAGTLRENSQNYSVSFDAEALVLVARKMITYDT
jgi:hypothetical protein